MLACNPSYVGGRGNHKFEVRSDKVSETLSTKTKTKRADCIAQGSGFKQKEGRKAILRPGWFILEQSYIKRPVPNCAVNCC
jgi:hypothetical protein